MATILSVPTSLSPLSLSKSHLSPYPSSSALTPVHLRRLGCSLRTNNLSLLKRRSEIVRASVEETTTNQNQNPLTIFFQAEGTMNEAAIPTVTKALKGTEGISDLKVQLVEGIASVELTKETTTQATGVASGLVEIIQGLGFTLQTLKLSFEDEEPIRMHHYN